MSRQCLGIHPLHRGMDWGDGPCMRLRARCVPAGQVRAAQAARPDLQEFLWQSMRLRQEQLRPSFTRLPPASQHPGVSL